jgi:tetraacyldisaccharide 4'-kinase
VNPLLLPASWVYGGVLGLRRAWFSLRPPARLPRPVVSVGNLTTGGTGKTETVAFLCRWLLAQELIPGVLSRGYKRRSRSAQVVVSRGHGPEVSVADAGDEPFALARRLPAAVVVVGPDRLATGRTAANLGADVLVLDDGFQRRFTVARDLEIVLVDAADPFGQEALLPAGRLREPLSALAQAGLLIVTRADQHAWENLTARLRTFAPGIPCLPARHRPVCLRALSGPTQLPAESLNGRRVLAVAGIARPQAFVRTLEMLGAEVAALRAFPDHHWYTPAEVAQLRQDAARLNAELVCTSKDAVRLPWPEAAQEPAWALEVEIEFLQGREILEARLQKIFL